MIINYNCPNCGGDLKFSPKIQKLFCGHCQYSEEVAERSDALRENMRDDGKACCPSCGAEFNGDEKQISGMCEYCGAPLIVTDRMEGEFAPVKLIPFKIDKANADAAFKEWVKRGKLIPGKFRKNSTLKKIKPMYVPYWLSDNFVNEKLHATATRVHTYVSGDYEIVETDHYDVYRDMDLLFTNVDYDASIELDDDMMHKIDPYSFEALEDFANPYLAGFESRQYDLNKEEIIPYVQQRVSKYARDYVRDSIMGYDTVTVLSDETYFYEQELEFILLPLWFLNLSYKGKDYSFMMNGQTGKVVGEPPSSFVRGLLWFLVAGLIGFIIAFIIGGFIL